MDLKEIMAISGKPGLYKFISQGRNAMIVENLETKKRSSAFSSDKVSALADIAIFTETEEVSLKDVLRLISDKEEGKETLSHKSSPDDLKNWFGEVLPKYDRERVYVSDIKKVIQWYHLLLKLDLLDFDEPEAAESKEIEKEAEPDKPEDKSKTKPKDKTVKSKSTTNPKSGTKLKTKGPGMTKSGESEKKN